MVFYDVKIVYITTGIIGRDWNEKYEIVRVQASTYASRIF